MPANVSSATQRILPAVPAQPTTQAVPLISVAMIGAPSACGLMFYPPAAAAHLSTDALAASLSHVLSAYPQICGRLRFARPTDQGKPYQKRYHRTWFEYGAKDDPGFVLETEARDAPMSAALPSTITEGVVDASVLKDSSLAPTLAPPAEDSGERPISGAKVTRFACGGAALCVAVSHIHFDAGALGTFVGDWAAVHIALARGDVPPVLERPYDPTAYDALAAGDLDADDEDPALVALEEQLHRLQYDSWASDAANPLPEGKGVPPELEAADAARGRRRGTVPPRHTRSTAPKLVYGLDFSAAEVERIAAKAKGETSEAVSSADAFTAHLWRLVARARGQGHTLIDYAMGCDSRARHSVRFPMTTPGCWNVVLGMQVRGEDVLGEHGLGFAAARIRQAINSTKPDVLAAWLHRAAHNLAPERYHVAFGGNTTFCTTNWTRTALHDADFGGGLPLLVHNVFPGFGGYATFTRTPGVVDGKWYEPGVRVTLWLEEEAMARLLADPEFRP